MNEELLIRNGYVAVGASATEHDSYTVNLGVATIVSNLATYGYTLDRKAFDALTAMKDVTAWWKRVEKALKTITGTSRNMGEYMVYKNFPREVLDMDRGTYVFHQIMIYYGVPVDQLREEEEPRPVLGDMKKLKVLSLADDTTADKIFANLQAMPNRWNDNQTVWANELFGKRNVVNFTDFAFKENAVALSAKFFEQIEISPSSATDVIRVAAALSDQDVSLREKVKFRRFKRPERRRLLAGLNEQGNMGEDFASRPEQWKRLLERLRPGDYKDDFPNVVAAYDGLYNKKVKTFAAQVDPQQPDVSVLKTVASRPGEFLRRFHNYYGLFGQAAVDAFLPVMEKLKTRQLVGLRGYLRTINERSFLIYPPKSNWSRAQVVPNGKTKITPEHRFALDSRISQILSKRLAEAFPEGVALDMRVDQVKLQTNDQKLAEYGRGTTFDIPEGITFFRSASYWQAGGGHSTVWYDNGWNFFGEGWYPMGSVGWDAGRYGADAAIFSGDPVNSKNLKGRGCQMADLYLDRLALMGVRYCVWNILCYSKQKFSQADEVLATLQMGEDAETGKVFEPSRAQMVFPLKSDALASYVAYLDLATRKLVYMDVPFSANVSGTLQNSEKLQKVMPAYVEYLDSLPTVLELMQDAPAGTMPVLYSDANVPIEGGRAFVFKPEGASNTFDRVTVTDLVNL